MSTIVFTSTNYFSSGLDGIVSLFHGLERIGHKVILVSNCDEQLTDNWRISHLDMFISSKEVDQSLLQEFDTNVKKWEQRTESLGINGSNNSYEYVLRNLVFANQLLEATHPDLVLIWNPFYPTFGILHDLAQSRGIHCGYIERGILPNTLLIDSKGFFAFSSLHALSIKDLDKQDKKNEWAEIGKYYLDSLQKDENLGLLYEPTLGKDEGFEWFRSENDSIKVLCLGGAEYQMGVYPLDHEDSNANMPLFTSSWEVANYLAQNKKWKILYKPHPYGSRVKPSYIEIENLKESQVSAVELIKAADVVLAWGTKLELSVLALNKPLVLVGNGLLWGKGCAVEVNEFKDLPLFVEAAIANEEKNLHINNLCIYLGWLVEEELFMFDPNHCHLSHSNYERVLSILYPERFAKKFDKLLISRENPKYLSFFFKQIHSERSKLERSQSQLQHTQSELERSQSIILTMRDSKFWKLKKIWSRLKCILSINQNKLF